MGRIRERGVKECGKGGPNLWKTCWKKKRNGKKPSRNNVFVTSNAAVAAPNGLEQSEDPRRNLESNLVFKDSLKLLTQAEDALEQEERALEKAEVGKLVLTSIKAPGSDASVDRIWAFMTIAFIVGAFILCSL